MALPQEMRPTFYEGEYLSAADLDAIVDFARSHDARHALGGHTWGIAAGLQLVEKPLAGGRVEVTILPGYAWDGFGRPIVVLAPMKVPEDKFTNFKWNVNQDPDGLLVEVWLRYDEIKAGNPPPGFAVCDTEDQFARVVETFAVEIGAKPIAADRHDPITLAGQAVAPDQALKKFDPSAVLYDESVPQQQFPADDAQARWLIPLGYVRWLPVQNQPGHFVARNDKGSDPDSAKIRRVRHYIGVVAETVNAAAGAVRVRDRTKDPATSHFEKGPLPSFFSQNKGKGYFREAQPDLVWIEGNLRAEGDVRIAGGRLDFRADDGLDHDTPLLIERVGDAGNAQALQVLLGPSAQADNQFAIGPIKDDGKLDQKFVVLSGGNVGIDAPQPPQLLTLGNPKQGTRLEIARTSSSLPWTQSTGFVNDGAFVINHQSQGSHQPNADFALMRDRKKRLMLGDKTTFLSSQDGGDILFLINQDEPGAQEVARMTAAGNVGIGAPAPVAKVQIKGDLALESIPNGAARPLPGGATLIWNDGTWLRLNQNLDFTKPIFGVHTPGLLAPMSLNVGGAGGWGDPLPGNVWVTGNVGIGTTTPAAKLQVSGGAIMPAVGNSRTAGIQFPSDPGGGAFDEAFIRYFVDVPGTETTKLLIGCQNDADDTIGFFQFNGERMTIRSGNVGIGTTDPLNLLHVNGDASKPTGLFWSSPCDARLKKDIEPLRDALSRLLQLRGVRFKWKEPEKMGNLTGPQMGLVAQEVETVFPEWISTSRNGYMQLTVTGFEALVIEALKELKTELENFKAQPKTKDSAAGEALTMEAVRELRAEIEGLKARLHKLETRRVAPGKK